MGVALLVLGMVFIYLLPSIVGKDKKNVGAIVVLNIFLGWTFVGWVIALVWATTKDDSENEEVETGILTREYAIAKLKEAKDLLDIEMITQDEFNVLKEEFAPIIKS